MKRNRDKSTSDKLWSIGIDIAPFTIVSLVILFFVNRAMFWRILIYVGLGILTIKIIILLVTKGKKMKYSKTKWELDDEDTLYMLKGMPAQEFEHKIAEMFGRLGYTTTNVGGANDHGIDIKAKKDEKIYFIQCKKYSENTEVTPHDVRDFLGTIKNVNDHADKGFFVTTGNISEMAKYAASGDPRIELIDGIKLIEYWKTSFEKINQSE